jgi:hypothetical protein
MSKKLTKEIVNEDLKDRGIELIGEYTNSRIPVLFRCANNHTWQTKLITIRKGHGCRICSGSKLTKEMVNNRIKDRGLELIGEFTFVKEKSLFRCVNNHEWMATPDTIMRGVGCNTCVIKASSLTKEEVNERLKDKGIEIISEYINNDHQSTFKCSNNHTWEAKTRNVFKGRGCLFCISRVPPTKKLINERLADKGIELIGEYVGQKVESLFRCNEGHKWNSTPLNAIKSQGCGFCNKTIRLTKKIVNERIKDRGFELIGEYKGGSMTKAIFKCNKGHKWNTLVQCVISGTGCPLCSLSGYSFDLPAHGYLLDFGHFIKFGISNVLSNRMRRIKASNKNFTLLKTKYFENGQDALAWENDIKKKYGGWYVTKDILPDGYTETLPVCFKETLISMLDI